MPSVKKHHYYLICGTILVAQDEDTSAVSLNAILPSDIKNIGVHQLGQAQRMLQMNFHQRMQDPETGEQETFKVVDVVIANMCYLGHMSQEQFEKRPEGFEIQEKGDQPVSPVSQPGLQVEDIFQSSPELDEAASALDLS
jgi:hypothetical protein